MGKAIVPLPNGRYSIWSTIVDNFVAMDGTKEDVLEYFAEAAKEEALRSWGEVFKAYEEDGFAMGIRDYEECLENIRDVHGEKEMEVIKKVLK